MKAFLTLLHFCVVVLVTGRHAEIDAYNTISQAGKSSGVLQLAQKSPGNDLSLLPRTYLMRRGNADTDRRKPTSLIQGNGGSSPSRKRGRESSTSPVRGEEAKPHSQASVDGHGPASLWAFNLPYQGDRRDIQRTLVQQGQHRSLNTQYHALAAAGGKSLGSPPRNAEQQPIESHPLKAQAQGRTVVGRVITPPGGHGNIRTETPAGVGNWPVPGGTTVVTDAQARGGDTAKVEASVTHGGKAQAGAQSHN